MEWPLPPPWDKGTHQASHWDMGTPWEPQQDMGTLLDAGLSSWTTRAFVASHSHGCLFSPTPALPLVPQRTFHKLACSSLARTTAFHVAASLDPLGRAVTRATGTVKFIAVKSAGSLRK